MSLIIKTHRCGARYTARQWRRLRFVSEIHDEQGELAPVELRVCTCGSSISVPLNYLTPRPRWHLAVAVGLGCAAAGLALLIAGGA